MSLKYLEIMETPVNSINITDTNPVDVVDYATAQIVDANLIASNIKAGVTILGITGTAEVVIPVEDVPETKATNVIYNESDGRYYGWED